MKYELTYSQKCAIYSEIAQSFVRNFFKDEHERKREMLGDGILFARARSLPEDDVKKIVDDVDADYTKRITNCLNELGSQADYMAILRYRDEKRD